VAVYCMMSVQRTRNGLFNSGEIERRMRALNWTR